MTTSIRPAREAAGERSSIAPLFAPRTIAVIGASRRTDSIGHEIVHNLVADGFSGAVFPVNPKANSVCSIRSYQSVADLPDALVPRGPSALWCKLPACLWRIGLLSDRLLCSPTGVTPT